MQLSIIEYFYQLNVSSAEYLEKLSYLADVFSIIVKDINFLPILCLFLSSKGAKIVNYKRPLLYVELK